MARKQQVQVQQQDQVKITDLSQDTPGIVADPVIETIGANASLKKTEQGVTATLGLTTKTREGSMNNTALAVGLLSIPTVGIGGSVAGIGYAVGLGAAACGIAGGAFAAVVLIGGIVLIYRAARKHSQK